MRSVLIHNWKTYIPSEDAAVALAAALHAPTDTLLVVCPSAVHIPVIREHLAGKGMYLGAQDFSVSRETPQTGRLSGDQLTDMGVQYVIVGHAETRANGVINAMVVEKVKHATATGITPIICISEQKKDEPSIGDEVVGQLQEIVEKTDSIEQSIIAYEPTAHIGAENALDTRAIGVITARLRGVLKKDSIPILYGGSVDADNAVDIMKNGGVNGFLLGRASVKADTANAITALF